MSVQDSLQLARGIRAQALRMVFRAKASHVGGALSMADLLAVLYSEILKVRPHEPAWSERDRLILSKGHSCTGLYAALALRGFFPMEELETYGRDHSRLMSHISHKVPGVEFSTGSLGHGLPFGCGKALAAKRLGHAWRTFVILSDGELNEGSNWEAILFAGHHRLDNLVALVRQHVIHGEFDHLRVDHQKAQGLRRMPIDQTRNYRVHADGLTAARGAGDEQMGHLS
jgi:transketolase